MKKLVAKYIAIHMKGRDLTYRDLADILRVSKSTAFAYMAGEQVPSLSKLLMLRNAWGMSVFDLVPKRPKRAAP